MRICESRVTIRPGTRFGCDNSGSPVPLVAECEPPDGDDPSSKRATRNTYRPALAPGAGAAVERVVVEIQWRGTGVLRRFSGRVSSEELAKSAVEIQSSPDFDSIRYILNDFRAASAIEADASRIAEMAARAAAAIRFPNHFRVAAVGTLPEVQLIADAFVELGFAAYPIRAFATMEDAVAWLDL